MSFLGVKVFKNTTITKQKYAPIEWVDTSTDDNEISFPGKWTNTIYQAITVATEDYDQKNEKYSFDGGANYKELEKIVGKPDTLISWEKEEYGYPPKIIATWDKSSDGYLANCSIDITYNKDTMMIIDKKMTNY